mmetsp:Transcript_21606/g.42972  ORF Transcript_21606/g.42972 Transcript_21606/m.42972 type:complete len:361 (+) Transcript_21606:581-1663(+)
MSMTSLFIFFFASSSRLASVAFSTAREMSSSISEGCISISSGASIIVFNFEASSATSESPDGMSSSKISSFLLRSTAILFSFISAPSLCWVLVASSVFAARSNFSPVMFLWMKETKEARLLSPWYLIPVPLSDSEAGKIFRFGIPGSGSRVLSVSLASQSNLQIRTFGTSFISFPRASMVGPTALQGPHHSAQTSRKEFIFGSRTNSSNDFAVTTVMPGWAGSASFGGRVCDLINFVAVPSFAAFAKATTSSTEEGKEVATNFFWIPEVQNRSDVVVRSLAGPTALTKPSSSASQLKMDIPRAARPSRERASKAACTSFPTLRPLSWSSLHETMKRPPFERKALTILPSLLESISYTVPV